MNKINWDKLIIFFIFSYAFFSPFSLAGSNVSLGLALICWAAKIIASGKFEIKKNPLNIPLVIFVAVVGISVLASTDLSHSLKKYNSMWMVCIFFLAANNITGKKQLKKIIALLVIVTVVVSIAGIIEHFMRVNLFRGSDFAVNKWLGESIPRASGSFSHPVKFGMYLIMILPIVLGSIFHEKKRGKQLWFIIFFVILLLALIFTYSRGCWVALLFASMFFGLLNLKLKKFLIIFSGLLIAMTLFTLLFSGSGFARRLKTVTDTRFNTSNVQRIVSWERCLRMIKDRPVLGVGWGRIEEENKKYVRGDEKPFNHAHNTYLNFAVETGLVGLGVLLWLLIIIFTWDFWIYRNAKDEYLKVVSCGVLAAIVAFMISGMIDCPFTVPVVTELFYFLTGILFAMSSFEVRSFGVRS